MAPRRPGPYGSAHVGDPRPLSARGTSIETQGILRGHALGTNCQASVEGVAPAADASRADPPSWSPGFSKKLHCLDSARCLSLNDDEGTNTWPKSKSTQPATARSVSAPRACSCARA